MKTTIIFAHPWHGSFNKAILDTTISKLEALKKEYHLIDLNKDQFNPVLQESSLALFSKGKSADNKVNEYQNMIKESDELIFIFPIWWFDTPAILKGFVDKVMLKDFAYSETPEGLVGLLTNINKTSVITTSEYPTQYLQNGIGNIFINMTLSTIGLQNVKWLNCETITTADDKHRKEFLNSVSDLFA